MARFSPRLLLCFALAACGSDEGPASPPDQPAAPAPGEAPAAGGPPAPALGTPGELPPGSPPPAGGAPGGPSNQPGDPPARDDNQAGSSSILARVGETHVLEEGGARTQDDIRRKLEFVTLSGVARCAGCTEPLVLRVVPYRSPSMEVSSDDRPGVLAFLPLAKAGAYSIIVPKDDRPVALELLVDSNKDGNPTKGERFAVLEGAGKILPGADRAGLDLDASSGGAEATTLDPLRPVDAEITEPGPAPSKDQTAPPPAAGG